MKISPDEFAPEVWATTDNGRPARILICAKRFSRGRENPPTWVFHPVAILLSTPCVILYPLRDNCHLWQTIPLAAAGLTTRTAQTALSEAWRDMESAERSFPDAMHSTFKANVPLVFHPKQCTKPQHLTMLRNVNAWLRWNDWEKRGLPPQARAAELSAMGFPTTTTGLRRAAEERGL